MMRLLPLLLLTLMAAPAQGQSLDLNEFRQRYYQAINDENLTENLLKELEPIIGRKPLYRAYYGGLKAIQAKHAWNPWNKFSYVSEGKEQLAQAIKAAPEHLEVRFIRYSLYYHLPGFLSDEQVLEEDEEVILQQLPNFRKFDIPRKLAENVRIFLIDSGRLTRAEVQQLQSLNL